MDEPELSRRRLLASTGVALSAGIAGCSLDAPKTKGRNRGGNRRANGRGDGFPSEYDQPDGIDELPADSELTELYRAVIDSVAAVRVEDEQGNSGGTAWVYDDRHLVTNEHVIRFSDSPYVWFREAGWREGSVVGTDKYSDLAVVEVGDTPEKATPLPLVEQPIPVGTPVAVVGNPYNLTGSFTHGVVSGRNRTIDLPSRTFSIANGIQTDAAVNPGNSGGPLVTYDADVAGVVSYAGGENIGLAISAAMTNRVVPALIKDGQFEHTYLGVWLRNVTPRIIEANDLGSVTYGVYIDRILEGGPSEGKLKSSTDTRTIRGLETPVGGDVIVKMDDQPILNRENLSTFLALRTDPGDTITIDVIRDGEHVSVDVTLAQRPDPEEAQNL